MNEDETNQRRFHLQIGIQLKSERRDLEPPDQRTRFSTPADEQAHDPAANCHRSRVAGQTASRCSRGKETSDIVIRPLELAAAEHDGQLEERNGRQLATGEAASARDSSPVESSSLRSQLSHSSGSSYPPAYHNIPGVVPSYRGRNSGPPPAYAEVTDPQANPPTYQSLFGQAREARKKSQSLWQWTKRLLVIVMGTLCCTLVLALIAFAPLAMIAVGSFFLDDCRVEHLPAFLLMGGLVLLTKNILQCYSHCEGRHTTLDASRLATPPGGASSNSHNHTSRPISQGSDHPHRQSSNFCSTAYAAAAAQTNSSGLRFGVSSCELLLNCILLGWYFAGCLIVFRSNEPDYVDKMSPRYCNHTLYMFTYYLIVSIGMVFIILISFVTLLMAGSAFWSRRDLGDLDSNL